MCVCVCGVCGVCVRVSTSVTCMCVSVGGVFVMSEACVCLWHVGVFVVCVYVYFCGLCVYVCDACVCLSMVCVPVYNACVWGVRVFMSVPCAHVHTGTSLGRVGPSPTTEAVCPWSSVTSLGSCGVTSCFPTFLLSSLGQPLILPAEGPR